MTLIVAMMNRRQAVLVSDRRVSRAGQVVTLLDEPEGDESNKAFVLVLRNARLGIAFTGLASNGKGFLAKRWLPEALMDAAAPDFLMGPTIQRFTERATRDFAGFSVDAPLDKHLSVVFVGFCYDELPPRAYCWLVSNFEDIHGAMLAEGKPATEFRCSYCRENRPAEEVVSLLFTAGADRAISQEARSSLCDLIQHDKPAHALVGKAVEVIREAANSFRSANTVGQQCCSLVLPSNPGEVAVGEYHSAKVAGRCYYPTFINAEGSGSGVYTVAEPSVRVRDDKDRPTMLSFPKVGRNHLCPCGSGRKYKRCHGRPIHGNPSAG